jgi:L-alanine-DL-glutamate epimerase-like enolase superfamily enzyme
MSYPRALVRITDVRAVTCDVPVPRPIVMGELRYDTRDYLVVEVLTDEGVTGIGFGMARYAPLAEVVARNIKPLLVGQDPLMTEWLWDRLYHLNLLIAQRGIYTRALSIVDVALWDIKGKVAGLPIWKLLGGHRTRVPVLMAGGYVAEDKDVGDLVEEVAGYVARGFRHIKIAAGRPEEDTERIRAARRAAGDATRLMYDAHWAWRDPVEALRLVRGWEDFDLSWIEDPFPSERLEPLARFREGTTIPLAIGEDTAGRWAFQALFDRGLADVARVDVTSAGGFTEAIKICALAAAHDLPVSPHVYPELHIHLAAGLANVTTVEMTDPPQGIEGLHLLMATTLEVRDGEAIAPERPGIGFEIDRAAVEKYGR